MLPERIMRAQPGMTHTAHAPAEPVTPHVSRICAPYKPIVEIDADYSRLPIDAGFNWSEAFADIDWGEWYLVVFRSQPPTRCGSRVSDLAGRAEPRAPPASIPGSSTTSSAPHAPMAAACRSASGTPSRMPWPPPPILSTRRP